MTRLELLFDDPREVAKLLVDQCKDDGEIYYTTPNGEAFYYYDEAVEDAYKWLMKDIGDGKNGYWFRD